MRSIGQVSGPVTLEVARFGRKFSLHLCHFLKFYPLSRRGRRLPRVQHHLFLPIIPKLNPILVELLVLLRGVGLKIAVVPGQPVKLFGVEGDTEVAHDVFRNTLGVYLHYVCL